MRGGAYEAIFGPSPPGVIAGAEVIGFRGKDEPGERRRLTWEERDAKRKRAKAARRAKRRAR